jgi:hypothetical protein
MGKVTRAKKKHRPAFPFSIHDSKSACHLFDAMARPAHLVSVFKTDTKLISVGF